MILAVVMFLVYRVVLSNIGPERFGLWTLILSLSSLGQFASFGLTGSLVKFVAKNHALGNAHAVSRAIEVCLLATGGLLLVAFLIVWPIIEYFVPFLSNAKSNDSIRWMIAAAMTTTWLLALSGIVYAGLEGLQRYVLRNAVAIAASPDVRSLSLDFNVSNGFGRAGCRTLYSSTSGSDSCLCAAQTMCESADTSLSLELGHLSGTTELRYPTSICLDGGSVV